MTDASHHGTYVATSDGTNIFYKDWGVGRPVVFSHGWPLNADAWDNQLYTLAANGYRAIAHDRRGHGRSSQTWAGNDMDTYADDLAAVIEALDLRDITLVGHSTGGGEVARYIGRHGSDRVRSVVLNSAVTPGLLQSPDNPNGVPMSAIEGIRQGVLADRSQFFQDLSGSFYGADQPGANVSPGLRHQFWRLSMQVGLQGAIDCIRAFSESDFIEDLKRIDVPTLIIHGDADQIVPITATAERAVKLLADVELKVYAGADHGLSATHQAQFNEDLLAFVAR